MDEPGVDWKTYVDTLFVSQEKAVRSALDAADKAVGKAEEQTRQWQQASNEWRGAMNDRERLFLPRPEYEVQQKGLVDRVGLLETQVRDASSRKLGMGELWGYLLGAAGVGLAVVAYIARG